MDYVAELRGLSKNHDFFIGFDSDGCVFDTMEIKHKECFCPAFIRQMGLQPVSRAAREVWEFVNLYSKKRGCNRFLALRDALGFLRERSDVKARKVEIPCMPELHAWIERETQLGNPALKREVESSGSDELRRCLDWSLEVNKRVEEMVFGITPFPGVIEVLERAMGQADLIVVSQTPLEALEREWRENGMEGFVRKIAGQEHGTKTEHIRFATEGKGYAADRVLMVGDAPGDFRAAEDNRACFFPIVPGHEESSWARLVHEGLDRFFNGTFTGEYQEALLKEFDAALPSTPHWENR